MYRLFTCHTTRAIVLERGIRRRDTPNKDPPLYSAHEQHIWVGEEIYIGNTEPSEYRHSLTSEKDVEEKGDERRHRPPYPRKATGGLVTAA